MAKAERLIEEAQRDQAEELDLSGLGLKELPASLGRLSNLKVLSLGWARTFKWKGSRVSHSRGSRELKDLSLLSKLKALQILDLSACESVTDLSALSGLSGLQSLSLWRTGVTELSALAGLSGLHRLDLSGTVVTDLSALSGLSSLQVLALSETRLADLSSLSKFININSLDLSNTGMADLSALSKLSGLQTLNIGMTLVTDLSILSRFSDLRDLDLSYLQVNDLSALSHLSSLRSLHLARAGATELSVLSSLSGLQSLDLSGTGVTELSPLSGLSSLQSLSLPYAKVKNLSALSALSGLQDLDLSATEVTDLSALSCLSALRILDLSETAVADLSALSNLSGLQKLDLSKTKIMNLSPLSNLTELQDLDLSETAVTDLSELSGLPVLRNLNISNTKIMDLSPLSSLTSLKVLNLRHCSGVADLSMLLNLFSLQHVGIYQCQPSPTIEFVRHILCCLPLSSLSVNDVVGIPGEVLSRGDYDNCLPRLRTYFSELDQGSETENEVKVILLGNGRVGKTQLCRRFRGQPFDDSVPSTHGVQIWREGLKIKAEGEEQTFQINWWDFGGQDIYHGTHSLFLRSRAVFLILWTPSLENRDEYLENGIPMRNQPIAYWLDYVRSLAGEGSPVIVVQNQCDEYSDRRPDPPRPRGFDFFECCAYSAKKDRGRETLEGQLRNAIGYLLERNGALEIGKGRAEVRRQLYEWRALDQALSPEDRRHRTLSLDDFQALCDQTGSIISWRHALDYFHHTGVVFYRLDLFSNRIILDQDWALDAVYAVFHRGQAMPWLRNSGRFTREDLAATVWQSYSPEEQRLFLGLMESCGVCFSYRKTGQEEPRYVAPDLLPGFEAVSDRVHLVWDEKRDTKTLSLKYRFFHPAVIRSLMSQVGQRARDLAEYWKYGLWFKDGRWNAQLLVQFKDTSTEEAPGAGVLELKAQGHYPLGLLREVRERLLGRHIGEQPEELLTLDGITVARNALSTIIGGQVLDTQGKSVPAAAFAAFFEDREYERGEGRSAEKISGIDIRPQPVGPDEKPREIYISYAWGDESEEGRRRAQAVDGLYSALAKDGFRPVRDKEAMRAGDLISAFIRQLTRADLVVAVISEKYLRSWYCMYEIYKIWQRSQSDAGEMVQRLVPIVLPEVRIGDVSERVPYMKYWADRAKTLEALVRDPDISPGGKSWEEFRLVKEFAHHVDDILVFLQDVLMPRNLEMHLDSGFEAVLEALRRRVETAGR